MCIVHWPKGIKAKGDIRHQFIHAIDLVPTTLEVLKLKMPASINGAFMVVATSIQRTSSVEFANSKNVQRNLSMQLQAMVEPKVKVIQVSYNAEVDEAMELLATGRGIGYVLKSRVSKVEDLTETVNRVIDGGSVVDPAIVEELVQVRHREDRLERLTQREREVLELMAEGASNAGIAKRLWVTEGTVEKHVRSILSKLSLPETPDDHRRVLAVLTFLDSH